MKLEIRRLTSDADLGDLLELSKAFFAEYERCHEEFFRVTELDEAGVEAYFRRFADLPGHVAFVAMENGVAVGYVTAYIAEQPDYWVHKRVGRISGLMVAPNRRRTGVGTRLLEAVRGYFRDNGVRYFTVYTAVSNRSGTEFYRQRGLEPLHTNWLGEV